MTTTATPKKPMASTDHALCETEPPAPPPALPHVLGDLVSIPIDDIRTNPGNPRSDLGDLEGLAASIKALGILEPLLVEPLADDLDILPEDFRLLAGHRRLAAASLAGLVEVPCIVRAAASDEIAVAIALVENLQREELSPLDEAAAFAALVTLGLSQRAIADRVGCSQALVSKRIALLELPSHVQARIRKGTMPLEAAGALTKLVGHPEKLKKAAGEAPSAIARAVERAEAAIAWEAKRSELVDVAKGRGWGVVDEPLQSWKPHSFATLARWGYSEAELDLDVAKHEAEPCHAVMIPGDPPTYGTQPPTATSVCTSPDRHKAAGGSVLKVAAPPKLRKTPAERQRDKELKERQKAAAEARAAHERRHAALVAAVAAYAPPRGRPSLGLRMTLRSVVDSASDLGVELPACELLGLDALDEDDGPLVGYVAVGDAELHRAALAVSIATSQEWLPHGEFSGPGVTDLYAFLAESGYEPSPYETTRLEEAVAERAERSANAKLAAVADDG